MTTSNEFLKVQTKLPSDSSEQVYLQEKEIQRLSLVETKNDQEREVRNLFIIACYTALRISDIQQLNKAIIRRGMISLYQQIGFPLINKAKANKIIKALAARCCINETVSYKEYRGGETTIVAVPKYEMISFHTARRSCATNLYKRGYPINYIMSLSGHRSFEAFRRYMKASSKELMSDFVRLLKKEKVILP